MQSKRMKREAAEKRNEAYQKLSLKDKMSRNSTKVRAKLEKLK